MMKQNDKFNYKKRIGSALLSLLFFVSLMTSASATSAPSQKEEVVYGILKADGTINNIYVVNIFQNGTVLDYGNYKKVQNLTSSEKLMQIGEEITATGSSEKLYYQGTLVSKELPWNIAIHYFLNGKELSGAKLAGKSGALELKISVTRNEKINNTFYDNDALQISLKLDTKLCENIKTENATIAEAGRDKQLSYTILPGKGAEISVKADVKRFEMEAISINGIKLSFDIPIDKSVFKAQITDLVDAIGKIDGGASDLLDGATKLSNGMAQYTEGLNAFQSGLAPMKSGFDTLNAGAIALSSGLSALTAQNKAIVSGALALQTATFQTVNDSLSKMGLGLPILTVENYNTILANIPDLATVKAQLDGTVQFTGGILGYTSGVAQLDLGAKDLSDGTTKLKSSVSMIATSANDLFQGASQINSSIAKLRDGLATYKEGTGKLTNGTSDMDAEIDTKIDELLNSISGNGANTVSFVSEKNTNITAVQFVLKTEAIAVPTTQTKSTTTPKQQGFWQKLMKLFQ